MTKLHVLSCFAMIALAVAMSGCSKDSVTGPQPNADAQAMQYMVESGDSVSAFSASEVFSIDDGGMRSPDYSGLAKAGIDPTIISRVNADATRPLRWGRRIFWDQIVRNYNVVPSGDTLALVTVTKTIPGEFWVGWGIHNLDTVILDTIVKKPFTEVSKRNIMFRRIGRHLDPRRNWIPVAITMVQGASQGSKNFSVASFELMEVSGHYDTTATDPLNTWFSLGLFRGTRPIFPVQDSIKVRVTINSSDDSTEIVYLRHGIAGDGLERRRSRMDLVSMSGTTGNYTRVYEKTFVTGLPRFILAERFNAVIDAFSYGTIYDKAAPFANEYWGMPYIVARF